MENTLDIVISFDDTGSMSSVRRQVREKINNFVTQIFDVNPNVRIGVIIHNDYCDIPEHMYSLDLCNDKEKIMSFVRRDSPCGGGDAKECYELALKVGSEMDWRAEKRVFVLIGDQLPQSVGYTYSYSKSNYAQDKWDRLIKTITAPNCGVKAEISDSRAMITVETNWMKEVEKLHEKGVTIYGIHALPSHSTQSFYTKIAQMTNGHKLELSQFAHIMDYVLAVVHHQQGTLDAYRQSEDRFKTNISLKSMFNKLMGVVSESTSNAEERIELLSKFQVMSVDYPEQIQEFVLRNGCTFKRGKGYYQLLERVNGKANSEKIQANKEVIFVHKETGEAISDTHWCREQLGIPYGTSGTVRPLNLPEVMRKYDVFIQSNSYNRNLDPGSKFLYELEHR